MPNTINEGRNALLKKEAFSSSLFQEPVMILPAACASIPIRIFTFIIAFPPQNATGEHKPRIFGHERKVSFAVRYAL
jgi:hypothetical protein